MSRYLLIVLLLFPLGVFAQVNLYKLKKAGEEIFAYKISMLDAEKYIKEDSIPVDRFLTGQPFRAMKNWNEEDSLPVGNYVLLNIGGDDIRAEIINVTNLCIAPLLNEQVPQLQVRRIDGNFVADARVWVNGSKTKYIPGAQTYRLKNKSIKDGETLVKVYADNDSTMVKLDGKEPYSPISKQRWRNFKGTKTGYIITWVPNKVRKLVKGYRPHRSGYKNVRGNGYVLFNQPKYKLTDTVKLKAYIITKKGKQCKDDVNVILEYRKNGIYKKQLLTKLSPVSPGAYVYQFALSDTMSLDQNYSVYFKRIKDDATIFSGSFSTEDYVLDEIAKYNFTSSQDVYFLGDSLRFTASATDANNLPLLDASATLTITTTSINSFYNNEVYVPDTLYKEEKKLATDGNTYFTIPAGTFPNAYLDLKAVLVFKNSNNEQQEKTLNIQYDPIKERIVVDIVKDSIFVDYRVKNKSIAAVGEMDIDGMIEHTEKIKFPYKGKIDPYAEYYTFYKEDNGKTTVKQLASIPGDYKLTFSPASTGDSIGFVLSNPYKIPVSFLVTDGNNVIASGQGSGKEVIWKQKEHNKRKIYTVSWQYTWGGRQHDGYDKVALLYKILDVNIKNAANVYPGQKDEVKIEVTDFKKRPVSDVNLAAVSYNSQFNKDIKMPVLPYLAKYKSKKGISWGKYENENKNDNSFLEKRYALSDHQQWRGKFGLDSINYYQLLFPAEPMKIIRTGIKSIIPQVSVHVVSKGKPQPICFFYLNRKMVYYNGTTAYEKYSFPATTTYNQLGVRLPDRYVEIDSIYLQPYYKHDIIINLDNLPAKATVQERPKYLTMEERRLINATIFQSAGNAGGYLWQNDKVVFFDGNQQLAGPFNTSDSMHYIMPCNFNIDFKFEPGYEYNISSKILRLERKSIVSEYMQYLKKKKKRQLMDMPCSIATWYKMGDTLVAPPQNLICNRAKPKLELPVTWKEQGRNMSGYGKLRYVVSSDTLYDYGKRNLQLKYVVLCSPAKNGKVYIFESPYDYRMTNIVPGEYELLLITDNSQAAGKKIIIKADTTLCLDAKEWKYKAGNEILATITRIYEEKQQQEYEAAKKMEEEKKKQKDESVTYSYTLKEVDKGTASMGGKVVDAISKYPIVGAVVILRNGTKQAGTITDTLGNFYFSNIREDEYNIEVNYIGYQNAYLKVNLSNGIKTQLEIKLSVANYDLNDVVVVGYGTTTSKSYKTSLSSMQISNALEGKVAGVIVEGSPGASNKMYIRGVSSFGGGQSPVYVVDGIVYDQLPASITPDMIASMDVLKDASATAIYGARGSNGVVIITTKKPGKMLRIDFKDYAIWQPNLLTDRKGRASFTAVYPDNVTGWKTYVFAIDKKKRIGQAASFTQAYKPVMAQLSLPQFLIEGDKATVVGKSMNYTSDNYKAHTTFSVQHTVTNENDITIPSKESVTAQLPLVAKTGSDTMTVGFRLETTTGFKDGEERKIPVFKTGTEETTGKFWILQKDTAVSFTADAGIQNIELSATNSSLDIMLSEIDNLKRYPYFCMEQTASKLRGLLMEKTIRENLKQPFTGQPDINKLVDKLQNGQNFDGSWGWWEKGTPSVYFTTYVINALLPLRSNTLVETNIRNGVLYLQNQLPYLNRSELLEALAALSEVGHLMQYEPYLNKIPFDSISLHQQWQYVRIKQNIKVNYKKELDSLMSQAQHGVLGSVHWGYDNYRWYSNATATTLLAYKVLGSDANSVQYKQPIIQYFMEQRGKGYWGNTAESAGILSAILPEMLNANAKAKDSARLYVTGDTTFTINKFPAVVKMSGTNKQLQVRKEGGGLTYASLYQEKWNPAPAAVTDIYNVSSAFSKNGQSVSYLKAGEKVTMNVNVYAKKEAEYVMVEIPIPAGCIYAAKPQDNWRIHKEYFKNKVVVFMESLSVGDHPFNIELEVRYSGTYTLNPAKVELMYFPTFFGRNTTQQVEIK